MQITHLYSFVTQYFLGLFKSQKKAKRVRDAKCNVVNLTSRCGLQASVDPREELSKTFQLITNGASKITLTHLVNLAKELGETMSESDLQEWINEADFDKDGSVGEDEFMKVMKIGGIKIPVD